jgi:uncharacterized repeat protein (TIGR01451 family)
MRWRALCAAAAATVMSLVLGSTALACAATSAPTPSFDGCLKDNGLSSPPGQSGKTVQVCKNVRVSKITTYTWTLTKTPTPGSVVLAPGAAAPIGYTLAATATPTVEWVVDGDVVVRTTNGDPTVSKVTDVITLPDGTTQTVVLAKSPFLLQESCDAEKTFHYRFVVTPGAAGAGTKKGTNTAKVEWTTPSSGNGSFSAPVDFTDGPNTNAAVYFRTATLSDAFAAPPPGLMVAVPTDPGPWTLAADDPSSLTRTFTSAIVNASLLCPASAWVGDTATLLPPSKPETVNHPTSSGGPKAAPVSASASVLVTADCAPPSGPTGPGQAGPPGGPGGPASGPSGGPPGGPAVQGPPGTVPQAPPGTVEQATSQNTTPGAPNPLPGAGPTGPNDQATAGGLQGPPKTPATSGGPGGPLCPAPTLMAQVVGPRRVAAGQRLTWRVQIRNAGRVIARRVVLSDRLPLGFSLLSSTPKATFAAGTLRFTVPALRPGRTAVVTMTMLVPRSAAGHRAGVATLKSACGGIESARTPVTVLKVPAQIIPAVTG